MNNYYIHKIYSYLNNWLGIPFMAIESDYSPEDVGQLQTRVEAFLEQIQE